LLNNFSAFYQKNIDIPHGTRPKSTELIYPIYNTFPAFLSRVITIVSGVYVANIVAKPGRQSQNGTNKTHLRKSVFLIFLNNHLTDYYTMTYCLKRKNKKRFFSFQSMPNLNFAELISL